jgi:hypothetical protein
MANVCDSFVEEVFTKAVNDNGKKFIISFSHYGNTLPFRLPNTAVYGSISCQYFARPDATAADEPWLRPDIEIDLDDKDAAWKFVIEKYGAKQ